jgi:hypothetical protein
VSDRYQLRATLCLFNTLLMLLGFILMRARAGFSNDVRYLGIFFATMGVHCNTPALLALNQSNTLGAANRAVSSGILIACGAVGGIIGSLIFRGEDAPTYGPGIYTSMGFCVYMWVALVTLIVVYRRKNRLLAQGGHVEGAPEGFRFSL